MVAKVGFVLVRMRREKILLLSVVLLAVDYFSYMILVFNLFEESGFNDPVMQVSKLQYKSSIV